MSAQHFCFALRDAAIFRGGAFLRVKPASASLELSLTAVTNCAHFCTFPSSCTQLGMPAVILVASACNRVAFLPCFYFPSDEVPTRMAQFATCTAVALFPNCRLVDRRAETRATVETRLCYCRDEAMSPLRRGYAV